MIKAVPNTNPKNAITYHWGDDHLLITLGNRTQARIKILFWAEFLFTTGMATIFLKEAFDFTGSILKTGSVVAAALLYLVASYRFFSRILYTEKIFLDQESMTIVQRTPFTLVNRSYKWADIGPIHYVGKTTKTDHPLKGNCYDYFGFETQERLIQNLHHDGNLYFNHLGYPVRFGKCVYSWDAEEMMRMMQLYAGASIKFGPEWKAMLQEMEWDN